MDNITWLLQLLVDGTHYNDLRAALAKFGFYHVQGLALGDGSSAVRVAAIKLIGAQNDREAGEALATLARDEDEDVRTAALDVLGRWRAAGLFEITV